MERPASVNIPTIPTVPVLIPAVPRSFYGTASLDWEGIRDPKGVG